MDVFIYHLYDWSIREAAAFRDTNGLGNLQIFTDDCNIAADFNWYGGCNGYRNPYCKSFFQCGGTA